MVGYVIPSKNPPPQPIYMKDDTRTLKHPENNNIIQFYFGMPVVVPSKLFNLTDVGLGNLPCKLDEIVGYLKGENPNPNGIPSYVWTAQTWEKLNKIKGDCSHWHSVKEEGMDKTSIQDLRDGKDSIEKVLLRY